MRYATLLLALWVSPALAQWVEFTPCGLQDPMKHTYPFELPEGPAPNIGPFWAWAPAITAVLGIKYQVETEVQCSMIFVQGTDLLVIGTTDEVLERIGKK